MPQKYHRTGHSLNLLIHWWPNILKRRCLYSKKRKSKPEGKTERERERKHIARDSERPRYDRDIERAGERAIKKQIWGREVSLIE